MNDYIYIITHKKVPLPRLAFYKSIQVGNGKECNCDFNDKKGISIAEKNRYYAELTALYWIWKNLKKHNVIGVCHYRRFFYLKNDVKNLVRKVETDIRSLDDEIKVKSLECF